MFVIEEIKRAVVDEQLADLGMKNLVFAFRPGRPMGEGVYERRGGWEDLEPDLRIANIDATHFHRASPERLDAAGDLGLAHAREIGRSTSRCIRNAQIVDDHFLRARANDDDAADLHVAAESRLERLLDTQPHEVREVRGSEVP